MMYLEQMENLNPLAFANNSVVTNTSITVFKYFCAGIWKLFRPPDSPIIEAFGTPYADTKFQG